MFSLRAPAEGSVKRLLEGQRDLPFSYPGVGMSRREAGPQGFRVAHDRIRLGTGSAAFERARAAVRAWTMFRMPWVRLYGATAPMGAGSAVAFAAQEPFLFSASVRDNIAFGKPGATTADVEAVVRDAGLTRDVADFPAGLATVIGERGVQLSGGQRQRVAVARAMLFDAPILILDDSLSGVDAETERAILAALRRRRAGKTTLIVSHRLATLSACDVTLILDEGRVVGFDSLTALSATNAYAQDLIERERLAAEVAKAAPRVAS